MAPTFFQLIAVNLQIKMLLHHLTLKNLIRGVLRKYNRSERHLWSKLGTEHSPDHLQTNNNGPNEKGDKAHQYKIYSLSTE